MADYLEQARLDALELLTPPNKYPAAEISIAGLEDPLLWLGVGYLVGKGQATYRGSYSFRLTLAGCVALKEAMDARSPQETASE